MPEESKTPSIVRFGPFELSTETGELRKNGIRKRLFGQPIQVLTLLVTTPGQVVTREQLQKALWPGDTFGDFERGLNAAVNRLRENLDDSATDPTYIETVPGRGYRFIGKLGSPGGGIGPGKTVSHYRILEVIGRGGMGIVYRAKDLKLGRHVALKFLPEELAANETALKRFRREASTASSLNHPNICTIYGIEQHDGQPFIVMELLQGQTLREYLMASALRRDRFEPVLDTDELLDIAQGILDGLEAAHAQGIIHRDIKPTNVFITNGRLVKILDFGLARLERTLNTEEFETDSLAGTPDGNTLPADALMTVAFGSALGSAGYMAPEQAEGENLDVRADLFSFGVVLYEMATGKPAFNGSTVADLWHSVLTQTPTRIHKLNPSIPPTLESVIHKAMDKSRDLRYQNATELRTDLMRLKLSLSNPPDPASKSTRHKSQTCVLVAAAPLVTVVEWANEIVVWVRYVGQGEQSDLQKLEAPLSTPTVFFHERTFAMDLTLGNGGNPQPTDIILRLDSPNFEPHTQVKKLSLSPGADSQLCTFLVKPCLAGDLVANLELLYTDDKIVASRSIRTKAILQKDASFTPRFSLSFPIVMSIYEQLRRESRSTSTDEIPTVEQRTRFLETVYEELRRDSRSFHIDGMPPVEGQRGFLQATAPHKSGVEPSVTEPQTALHRWMPKVDQFAGVMQRLRTLVGGSDESKVTPTAPSLNDVPIAILQVESVGGHGRSYTVTRRMTYVTIGRSTACDVTIPDARVSRYHCTLEVETVKPQSGNTVQHRFILTDSHSRQGTYVGGEPVQRVELRDGDRIQVSDVRFKFIVLS